MAVSLFHRFFHRDSNGHGSADHRVVAHADEAHHLYVSRNGRAARELRVAVHTAHCIRHAVGSGTRSHIVRMQRSARAAARSNGEVFLAIFDRPFLVGTRNRMLETSRIGGVACDGNVHALVAHDRNALVYVVAAIAAHLGAVAVRIFCFGNDIQLACRIIIICFNIRKTVDTGDDLRGVFAKAV